MRVDRLRKKKKRIFRKDKKSVIKNDSLEIDEKKGPKVLTETEKRDRIAKDILKEILIAVLICIILLFFVIPTKVSEHSMQPTINDGDVLLLNKHLYIHPEPGDIVVFKSDLKDADGTNMNLIKRVIGTEGDVITITNGKLYRNGEIVEEDYIYGECTGEVYNYTVPKGKIYVLGDHREVSRDSREIGAVDEDDVIGIAFFRVWPLKDIGVVH